MVLLLQANIVLPKSQSKYLCLVCEHYLSLDILFKYLTLYKEIHIECLQHQFALSGGSEEPLHALACRVLLEGSSMEILQEVLSVYPEDAACAPEDVLLQALRIILGFWKNQDIEVRRMPI